jgi:transcriptional regulator with XRE-family HTH domain
LTLTGVAEATGISKSTLSRPETGQRRPTLELLFALSRASGCHSTTSVDGSEVGDPRIRLKAGHLKGRTVIPLMALPSLRAADPGRERFARLVDLDDLSAASPS